MRPSQAISLSRPRKLNLRGGVKSLKPSGRAGRYRATTNQWSQRSPRQSLVCILTSTGSVAVDAAVWQRSLVELVEYAHRSGQLWSQWREGTNQGEGESMLMAYLEMQMLSSSLALIWAQTRSRRRRRWGNPEIATRWKSPGSSLQAPSPQAISTRYNQAYLVNAG